MQATHVSTFAIYKKSKRAKDLHLVAWPIEAANTADALTVYLEHRRAAGQPLKDLRWRERLRVFAADATTRPASKISHYGQGKDNRRRFRSL